MANIILPAVPVLQEINNDTTLLIEQAGEINRYPISNLDVDIDIDESLSAVSVNPVQNKVINDAIQKLTNNKADTIQSASGKNITTNNAAFAPIQGLKLFGKTTQNGTPSPDAPVPLVSAGDGGSLGVTVAGKNLFDLRRFVSTEDISATIEENSVTLVSKVSNWYSAYYVVITLEPNAKYTVSAYASSNGKSPYRFIAVKINGVNVGQNHNLQSDGVLSVTFTTDSSGEATLAFGTNYAAGYQEVTYSNIQLEYGATVTEYEPYKPVQTLTLSTPNGLPGIPVTSGGNYTDESGQQWVCDEVDFGRGVYVQRIGKMVFDGAGSFSLSSEGIFTFNIANALNINSTNQNNLIGVKCSHYRSTYWSAVGALKETGCALKWGNGIGIRDNNFTTKEQFSEFAQENPITIYYLFAEPVYHDLSAEELAAYAALHTNYPNTTIFNDGGAGMEVKYCTPLTSVPMVHGEADSGKILAIDEHGCVTKVDMDDFGSGSIDVDFDISNEAEANPINADTLGGLLASDYAKQVDLNNLKNNLDNLDAGLQMELLWENASPDSNFAAQTINLDLDGYERIKIEWRLHVKLENYIYGEYTVGNGIAISYASSVASYRTAFFTENSITFNAPVQHTYTGNNAENVALFIPIKIYGIKGGSA